MATTTSHNLGNDWFMYWTKGTNEKVVFAHGTKSTTITLNAESVKKLREILNTCDTREEALKQLGEGR